MLMSLKTFGRVQRFWHELMFLPPPSIPGLPSWAARSPARCPSARSSPWQGPSDPAIVPSSQTRACGLRFHSRQQQALRRIRSARRSAMDRWTGSIWCF